MKRKLCFVLHTMARGGAERVMSIITNYAAREENEVYLILLGAPKVEYVLDPKINIIKLSEKMSKKNRLAKVFERRSVLRKAITSIKPDLVVSFLTMCNIYTIAALRHTNIPVIVSERNDPLKECPSRVKRFVRNYYYRFASGFVFQTDDAKKHFSSKIQNRSVVIPNPVKNDLPYASRAKANKIVAAARLYEQKNYPMMLRAFKMFLNDHPSYTLNIYGDGYLKESLIALSKELNIDRNVIFEGNVVDLHERIKDAEMFVLSSDYEGISNSLLEAMAMGLPCISTDCPCGGSRMLIDNGVSGILTPVGDEVAFCDAMKRIADNEQLIETLSDNALRVRELYSEEVILNRYFDYFDLILQCGDKK